MTWRQEKKKNDPAEPSSPSGSPASFLPSLFIQARSTAQVSSTAEGIKFRRKNIFFMHLMFFFVCFFNSGFEQLLIILHVSTLYFSGTVPFNLWGTLVSKH